jgi:prevent-host-death family protein
MARRRQLGHIGHVKTMSLAKAKAHISELVDQAEHHGARTLISRHGKPVAAIVPVDVAKPTPRRPKPMSDDEVARSVQAFIDEFSAAEPEVSAVDDLLLGRR